MEDTVPSVSNGPSGGGATSRRTIAPQSPSSSTPASEHPRSLNTSTRQDDDDDDHRDNPRRRTQRSIQSLLLTIVTSPTTLLFRLIAIVILMLQVALRPFHIASRWIFPKGEWDGLHSSESGIRAAKAFVQFFIKRYVLTQDSDSSSSSEEISSSSEEEESHPLVPFVQTGYQETVASILDMDRTYTASNSNNDNNSTDFGGGDLAPPPPLLLIYLHAPLHPASHDFCTKTLSKTSTLELLSSYSAQGLVHCWAGSLHSAEGNHLASTLKVVRYPFLALVKPNPTRRTAQNNVSTGGNDAVLPPSSLEVYLRMEGPALTAASSNTFQTYLQTALEAYQTQLSQQTQARIQRQEEVRLRQEQDAEYEAALQADRERAAAKAQEAERAREEAERLEREAQAVRDAEEAAVLAKQEFLKRAQSVLEARGEPAAGDVGAKIRFVLPTGQKILRKFWPDDTLEVIRAFLIVYFSQNDVDIANFGLSTNYPKKELVNEECTLESEGLCPQAVIMVQDLDA